LLNYLLGLGVLGLAGFDAWFSKRRMLKYGGFVELNNGIREARSLDWGLFSRIILPNFILIAFLTLMGATTLLGVFLGFRLATAYYQVVSMGWEAEIDKRLASGGTESVAPSTTATTNSSKLPPDPGDSAN